MILSNDFDEDYEDFICCKNCGKSINIHTDQVFTIGDYGDFEYCCSQQCYDVVTGTKTLTKEQEYLIDQIQQNKFSKQWFCQDCNQTLTASSKPYHNKDHWLKTIYVIN